MTVFLISSLGKGWRLKADASSSFLLVNACNRRAQFLFLLVLHYNSLVTSLVNMRAGVTIACDTIEQATFFLHRRACNYVPTNWSLFFGGHDAQKWKKNNLWLWLEVGLCLGGGSWLTRAQVWLLKIFSFESDFWKP